MATNRVDSTSFPRLSAYLDFLPGGLDAHRECQVKSAIFREFACDRRLEPAHLALLPEPLGLLLANPEAGDTWMPETHLMGSLMAIADALRFSDEEMERWLLAGNHALLGGRVFKVLMSMSAPELLMPLARIKWNTLRRGTSFSVETGKKSCVATVRFPARLFDQHCLKTFVPAFAAVLEVSNAKAPKPRLEHFDETSATYLANWA